MLEHNGFYNDELAVLSRELKKRFHEVFGDPKPVAADAVGVCESKTIFLRQALVQDPFTGLSLISYPDDVECIARSAVKITHSVLETKEAVEMRNTIEVHDHRERLVKGDLARIILEKRNSERWRCKVKEIGNQDGSYVSRLDRVATLEDLAFFRSILGFALYSNIEDAIGMDAVIKQEELAEMEPYQVTNN